MRQRGFIQLPMMAWAAIATGVVILGLGTALKVQSSRLDTCKAEYAQFKAEVKVLGEAAIKAAKAREADDKSRKEKADAENSKTKRDLAGLYDAYRSLRDQRGSRWSLLPPAAAGSPSPDRASFDRASLDRGMAEADGVLQRGAEKILLRGDTAIKDLDTARAWAQR